MPEVNLISFSLSNFIRVSVSFCRIYSLSVGECLKVISIQALDSIVHLTIRNTSDDWHLFALGDNTALRDQNLIHRVTYTNAQLQALFAAADLTPRQALRTLRSPAEELGLLDESVSDDALLDAMLIHPVLVNRPIVCTPKGVKMCRPSEQVLDLLDTWPEGPLYNKNCEMILNEKGERVV